MNGDELAEGTGATFFPIALPSASPKTLGLRPRWAKLRPGR
jgi:hypothetical protein